LKKKAKAGSKIKRATGGRFFLVRVIHRLHIFKAINSDPEIFKNFRIFVYISIDEYVILFRKIYFYNIKCE